MSVEASDIITIPRAELDALKAGLRRLRRQVGGALPGVMRGLIADYDGSVDYPGYSPANLTIITEAVMICRAQAEASQPGNQVFLILKTIRWAGGMKTANVVQNAVPTHLGGL